MSYEGFERWLCRNGHLHEADCYNAPNRRDWLCDICGEPMRWWEDVDQTNNAGVQTKLKVFEPAKTDTCDCCGHSKQTEPPTYYVPSVPLLSAALVPTISCGYEVLDGSGKDFATKDEAWDYLIAEEEI